MTTARPIHSRSELDLGVANGQLTATVSDALLDNVALDQARISVWNQTIANRIGDIARRAPNVTLQSVTITPDSVTMTWQVTK